MTLDQWKTAVGIVESVAKIAALVIGASWTYMLFINKRQRYPRAAVSHQVATYPMSDGRSVLRITLTVKNTGEVLMRIESGQVRVQQVSPLVTAEPPEREGFAGSDGQFEYDWPEIGRVPLAYSPDRCLEVEPGESEVINFDLFIDGNLRAVQVYTYLKNVTKRRKEIGWNWTTIHQLDQPRPAEGSFE